MSKITRFYKLIDYIGVKKDYPLHQFYNDSVKTITINRFTGRPYNRYEYDDYYEYSPVIWNKLVDILKDDAKKYNMELVVKNEPYGYAYLAPKWLHKKNPTNPTLKIPIKKDNLKHLFEAEKHLSKAGVKFDTGTRLVEPFERHWELDYSLRGAKLSNPVKSYITKGTSIVEGKPQYRGYYISATGFMIPQCKRILKKKAIRVYSLSSPEYVRKLDKAAFAFESAKLRDEALKKILTKMKNKYIIRYTKGYWYFSKKRE